MHGSAGRLTGDAVRAVVADACFPSLADPASVPAGPGSIGLETELLAIRPATPPRRLDLRAVVDVLAELASRDVMVQGPVEEADGLVTFLVEGGGRLTFEPGAQVEISGPCLATVADAMRDLERTTDALARAFDRAGIVLASAGRDVWTDATVAQQLTAPRYPAMASYLASRGPWGEIMMRHTASMQVNLDLGSGATARDRYEVALLASPLTAATFASSPERHGPPVASARATAWRHLDPTRTGVPAGLVDGERDPIAMMVRAALDADVLLVRGDDGTATPGVPGHTFGAWLRDGHPVHGYPSEADLRYHLTTLFHEVRPRGALEIRGVDALPARWRSAPVTLLAGLLYDERARSHALDVLRPHVRTLVDDLTVASSRGLAEPALCARAVEVWSYALEGARRLPDAYAREVDLLTAERYIDHFTTRGRAPSDELRDLLARDAELALAWASEPLPTTSRTAR